RNGKPSESDARKQQEQEGAEQKNRKGQAAREQQEAPADDASTSQDAWHIDRHPRSIPRPLPIVPLDLAAQMTEHQRTGGEHQKTDQRDRIGESATQDRAGDEMQERQEDDLMVVG